MYADTIGKSLGLRKHGHSWNGACPCCSYKTGFTVEERDHRVLVKCHAGGCTQADVIEALRRRGLWAGEEDREWSPPPPRQPEPAPADTGAFARALWQRTLPAAGTLVQTYLAGRGITIPVPPALRFHPACRHTGTGRTFPAMVAAVTKADGGEPVAVHRTYLAAHGRDKADVGDAKKTLGPKVGGAVRLSVAGPTLVVGEGIETVLSVIEATGLPGWAALDAGNLRVMELPPLPLAAEVIIAADNDENGVGQSAAQAAAARWTAQGRQVRIALPPTMGTDFNDLLRAPGHA